MDLGMRVKGTRRRRARGWNEGREGAIYINSRETKALAANEIKDR